MKKASELIGKEVINLSGAIFEGTVDKIYLDKCYKKIKFLLLYKKDKRELMEVGAIYKISERAIVIKNGDSILDDLQFCDKEFSTWSEGLKCYSSSGKFLGESSDIVFSDKFTPKTVMIGEEEFPVSKILSASDEIIVIKDDNVRLGVSKKIPRIKVQSTVKIIEEPIDFSATKNDRKIVSKKIVLNQKKLSKNDFPGRIVTGYDFLLGREVIFDIYDLSGELLVEKGSEITGEIVEKVKKSGKLAELAANSLMKNRFFF